MKAERHWWLAACLIWLGLAGSPALAQDAGVSIGQVTEVRGVAVAYTSMGERRRLERGSEVYQGETLITGADALAKMRFRDGAFFMLGENAQFRAENFTVNENPDESKSFYRLLKGGLRFVSGLIGKARPDNFEIRTSVATIGVRGTSGEVHVSDNGQMNVYTESGKLMATLPSGRRIAIAQGQGWSQRQGQPANAPSAGKPADMPNDPQLQNENLQQSADQANQMLPTPTGPQTPATPVAPSTPSGPQDGQGSTSMPGGGGATGVELASPDR